MNICSEHDNEDIAYEGGACPACTHVDELRKEITDLESTIARLESDIDDRDSTISSLEDEIQKNS